MGERRTAVAAAVLLAAGVLATGAVAQLAPPPDLAGENFKAGEGHVEAFPPVGAINIEFTCDPQGGTVSFTASGPAAGPYPGTFTESGTFTLGPSDMPNGFGTRGLKTAQIQFTIDSAVGRVTGTKTFSGPVGSAQTPVAFCWPVTSFLHHTQVTTFLNLRYEARIASRCGTYVDRGYASLHLVDARRNIEPLPYREAEEFRETFASDGVPPMPQGGGGDAKHCVRDLAAQLAPMSMHHGVRHSLMVKLEGAIAALERGNTHAACGMLGAFANEVRAQRGKKVSEAQATVLLAGATVATTAIGCR